MKELQFPEFRIRFSKQIPDEITLMVLGGRTPGVAWLCYLDFYTRLWCVDRGVEVCRKAGLVPDRLIGDRDSASMEAWNWAVREGVSVAKFERDKDLTDFQLALEVLLQDPAPEQKGVFLTGAFGGRFDHMWSTMLSFMWWNDGYLPIGMADENEALFLIRGGEKAVLTFFRQPRAVSLIPFESSRKVSISGTKWTLDDVDLDYRHPYSISNRIESGDTVSVSAGSGLVGFYAEWPASGGESL